MYVCNEIHPMHGMEHIKDTSTNFGLKLSCVIKCHCLMHVHLITEKSSSAHKPINQNTSVFNINVLVSFAFDKEKSTGQSCSSV